MSGSIGGKVFVDEKLTAAWKKFKTDHNLTWEQVSRGITTNTRYIHTINKKISDRGQATVDQELIEKFCARMDIFLKDIVMEDLLHKNKPMNSGKKFDNYDSDKYQELKFIGADTLTITTLAKTFCQLDCTHDVPVNVTGYDNLNNISDVEYTGYITDAELRGYQRTVTILGSNEDGISEEIDIGGDNASVERIASNSFNMHVPKEIMSEIAGQAINIGSQMPFGISIGQRSTSDLEKMVAFFIENYAITYAIDMAKQIRTPIAASYLMGALEKDWGAKVNSQLTDSFRVFSRLCKGNKRLANKITQTLIQYIIEHEQKDNYLDAIIYAAEALGYIARFSEKPRKEAFSYLSNYIIKNGMSKRLRDVVWASLISMERTCCVPDVEMPSIQDKINLDDHYLKLAHYRFNLARTKIINIINRRK